MKVFFTGSPRALKTYKDEHIAIYKAISEAGAQHLSDLVIKAHPDTFYEMEREDVAQHYKATVQNLKNADVIIVESSMHSLSMGFLVDKALEHNKPVIVLHLPKMVPFFLSGLEDEKLQILEYSLENVNSVVKAALEYAVDAADIRFNFFISPTISNYLDWISKNKRIPRSVYLRRLIEQDMQKNDEYEAAA